MKTALTIIILVAIALGIAYFFGYDADSPGTADFTTAEGIVTEVDLEGVAADGPALITLQAEEGDSQIVAVPSMGLPLCAAVEEIASPFDLEVGDRVSVAGAVDAEGRIVPCEDDTHYLRAHGMFRDATLGFEFPYRKGPDGYIALEDREGAGDDFVGGVTLFNRDEYEEFQSSTDAREGPPSIHIGVYDNTEDLDVSAWLDAHTLESNIELALGEPKEVRVGSEDAVQYLVDGLYPTDTYVIAHDTYVYVLSGAYLSEEDAIREDFESLVASFVFIPTTSPVE